MQINLEKSLIIPGHMDREELLWLAKQATLHEHIIELGCAQGRSTRALADHCSGTVIAIDLWKKEPDFKAFQSNLSDHIESGKVIVMQMDHASMASFAEPADMIFIDGSHAREHVKRDIQNALQFVMTGGLLCGHDYSIAGPGVVRAVLELLPTAECAPYTSIWYKTI